MRWQEIVESKETWFTASDIYRVYPELKQRKDLEHAVKWFSGVSPDECEFSLSLESIETFRSQIDEMVASYPTFPKERARTKKIASEIKNGERALPVFVEYGDDRNFIIEGRHRIVAFDQLGMKKAIVCWVKVP